MSTMPWEQISNRNHPGGPGALAVGGGPEGAQGVATGVIFNDFCNCSQGPTQVFECLDIR